MMAKTHEASRSPANTPKATPRSRRGAARATVLVTAALAVAGMSLTTDSEAGPNAQLEAALKALGRPYKEDGINLLVTVQAGNRSQLVRVTTPVKELHYKDNPKSGKLELRRGRALRARAETAKRQGTVSFLQGFARFLLVFGGLVLVGALVTALALEIFFDMPARG